MNEKLEQAAFPLWEAVCAKTAQAPYTILYEDDAVLVCTKKAGIPVQSKNLRTPDLESMLLAHLTGRQTGGSPYAAAVRENACSAHVTAGMGNAHGAQAASGRGCAHSAQAAFGRECAQSGQAASGRGCAHGAQAASGRGCAHGAQAASGRGCAQSGQAASGRGQTSAAPYLGIVHRLDQPVCGVLVFAKTPKAAAALSKQVQNGAMRKEYLAVCSTSLQQHDTAGQRTGGATGQRAACGQAQMVTVTDYLIKDGRTNLSRVVPEGTKGAKRAMLEMEVLGTQDAQSLVHVRLHTGRHHQIRLQLAHLGLPIAGDKKYGLQAKQAGFTQLMLCAYRLAFTHPLTGKRMEFDLSEEQYNGKSEF